LVALRLAVAFTWSVDHLSAGAKWPESRINRDGEGCPETGQDMAIFVGCAGWNLRKEFADDFPFSGTHLERYARRLNGVEINSSFYRSHRMATYQRWADSTPSDFRFSVKVPKQITHVSRLIDVEPQIEQLRAETSGLGGKMAAVLVQLPPSLRFDESVVEPFFNALKASLNTPIACEPRHPSWFESEAESLMQECGVERVAADPSIVPEASVPGGCKQNLYFRWHGSPRMYYSAYDDRVLVDLASRLQATNKKARSVWCIFDNTAEGAALKNALVLRRMLEA
jgi:uncharacterized protein YecE (DUF72 family)